MERQPTCYNCIHASINPGHAGSYYEPPEPMHIEECGNQNVDQNIGDKVEWDTDKMPAICGGFTPHLINKCMRTLCSKPMGTPEYLSIYIEYCKESGEPLHFCSDGCQDAFAIEQQWEQEEERRDEVI